VVVGVELTGEIFSLTFSPPDPPRFPPEPPDLLEFPPTGGLSGFETSLNRSGEIPGGSVKTPQGATIVVDTGVDPPGWFTSVLTGGGFWVDGRDESEGERVRGEEKEVGGGFFLCIARTYPYLASSAVTFYVVFIFTPNSFSVFFLSFSPSMSAFATRYLSVPSL
jgi:hypothetical protein